MKKYITAVISIAIIACMNTGCHEDKNNTSPITTMQTTQFDGVQGNCSNGGVKIEVLVDGTVDDAQTQYLCNGDNGVNGQNGIDGSNGQDGKDGRDGRDGQVGKDGRDGQDGQDGQNGHNALVSTSDEVGDNCALGGMRIDVGLDENNNSTLDSDEILATRYVCNGSNGQDGQNGHNALISTSDEVGTNCADGGMRIDVGLDENNNSILDTDEILATRYVCNGSDGQDGQDGQNGHNALVSTSDEVGTNCANGGIRIDVGLDENNNSTLDTDEILATRYVCNGEDDQNGSNGTNASIRTTAFEGAQGSCTNGGTKIEVLVDGIVDDTQTQYICNVIYPALHLLADTHVFYVSESGEKSDIGVSLSSCPVMPTTVTATTDKPEECGIYSEDSKNVVTSVDLLFNSENCGTAQKVTVIGIDDKVDDDNAACKLILTASSEDTNVNTSYNGMTLEVEGINEDNDTAGMTFIANPVAIQEGGSDYYSGNIEVKLNTQPVSKVTIHLTATNADASDTEQHLSLIASQLVFTPDNYNITQSVPFTGVRDYVARAVAPVIVQGTASSSDSKYDKMSKTANVNVNNIDTIGVDIKASGTVLDESKSTQSQTVTVKLKSKPTHDVTVELTRENDRIKVAPSNSSILASNKATQTIKPDEWDTGKTFYVFPNDDSTRNTNNIANLEVATDSDDYDYFGYFLKTPDFRVIDDESITNGKLNVSCSGTAGCTSVQGFAKCTFSLDTNNRPADKTDVRITCTSPDTVIWVHDATLTNSGNYSISDVDAGGGKCGAAMEGDRFGTSTITCTAASSTGFKATGSTSLKYSYHHLEWP